jgi:hypothetical protein
VNEQGKRVADA